MGIFNPSNPLKSCSRRGETLIFTTSTFSKLGQNMVKKACQEGIEIIENCGENRLKNSIFDNVLLKTMFYAILQPLWTVLAHFWNILGRFWVHFGITKTAKNQTGHNKTSSWTPRSLRKASGDDFWSIWNDFWLISSLPGTLLYLVWLASGNDF